MPDSADINIGMACNCKCRFCVQGNATAEQRKWVPLEDVKSEIEYYYNKGCRTLGFLGGEPTIYPYIFEVLSYARNLGYSNITLDSNGIKYEDKDFVLKLIETGVNRFCISIHSHKEQIEDFLTNRPGSFKSKIKGIKNLVELQNEGKLLHNISFNAVLNKINYKYIVSFIKFYKKIGIRDIRFNFVRPEGRAENNKDIVPTFEEVMPFVLKSILFNENFINISLSFGEIPLCVYPEEVLRNNYLCENYIGEFRDVPTNVTTFGASDKVDGRMRFIWEDVRKGLLKTILLKCKGCRLLNLCGGVWKGYTKLYGEKEFNAIL